MPAPDRFVRWRRSRRRGSRRSVVERGMHPFQHAFVQRLSELGIAYRGSSIVEGPGARYFDDSLRGGAGIRSRFLLVCDRDADPALKDASTQLCERLAGVVELRWGARQEITLVRPDGYAAFTAGIRDGLGALESVRSMLERQTRSG